MTRKSGVAESNIWSKHVNRGNELRNVSSPSTVDKFAVFDAFSQTFREACDHLLDSTLLRK